MDACEISLYIAHRRFGGGQCAQHVIEDLHLRQPGCVVTWRADQGPWVAPQGGLLIALFFCPTACPLVLCGFEFLLDGSLADACALAGEIAQVLQFIGAQCRQRGRDGRTWRPPR